MQNWTNMRDFVRNDRPKPLGETLCFFRNVHNFCVSQ